MMKRSAERIQFLADILVGAVENGGYGGLFSKEWHCPRGEEQTWYAVMYEMEGGQEYRVDLDTIARGLGIISKARMATTPVETRTYTLDGEQHSYQVGGEEVLHNAKGERLYMSQEMRRDIMKASFVNDAAGAPDGGDLDVIHYLAIMECGIYDRVVFG